MAFTFLEDTESISPQSIAASLRAGKASWNYQVAIDNTGDPLSLITIGQNIIASLVAIFGNGSKVSDAAGDGRLQRTLPKAHPLFPFWYANGIGDIRGVGGKYVQATSQSNLESTAFIDAWACYPQYKYTIDFGPVPYAIVKDENINLVTQATWVDDTGANQTYRYAEEWLRFTNWIPTPAFENVTYQLGQMQFRAQIGAPIVAIKNIFQGFPRIFLPNQLISFFWYGVPLRYITSANSYLNKYAGRINQTDWYNWTKGQLLYLGYKPTVYTPPVPELMHVAPNVNVFSTDKLVDLELLLLLTTRTNADNPPTINNGNWLPYGHNLLPWFKDRKFHYATVADPSSGTDLSKQVPSWLSFPFQLLFTDPDTPQP